MDPVWLFPIAIAVASVAMSSGIAGSNFWIPIYLLGLGLEPRVAFWMSLLTMIFGSGSGVVRNYRLGTLDRSTIVSILPWIAAGALVGALVSTSLPIRWLLLGFGCFAAGYGVLVLREVARAGSATSGGRPARLADGRWRGLIAGFLQGVLATGSGVVLLPYLLRHPRLSRAATAVGSSVALVFAASLVAVLARVDRALVQVLLDRREEIVGMMWFAAPGVVVGGQLGPRIAARLSRRLVRGYVGGILVAVGGLILVRALWLG